MKVVCKKLAAIVLALCLTFGGNLPSGWMGASEVYAHSGRTDGSGGHRDNQNKSGLGSYHYHCGGHPAHLHKNGVCPYSSSAKTTVSSSTKSSSSVIKKAQKALNTKGYSCGTPDGVMGSKTKQALKKFQKDQGLTVDGKIGPKTKKALGI